MLYCLTLVNTVLLITGGTTLATGLPYESIRIKSMSLAIISLIAIDDKATLDDAIITVSVSGGT